MKISTKVLALVVLFFVIILVDGIVSHHLLTRIGFELKDVVQKDIVLMQTVTSITRLQLQKTVVFERARRISEEISHQETTPARKEYLIFHTQISQTSFKEYTKEGALNIVRAKTLIEENLKNTYLDKDARLSFEQLASILKEIEKAHIHYDALADSLFDTIINKRAEFTQDDWAQIHRDERKLATELQNLVEVVQRFTENSLLKADTYQQTAQRLLWGMLILSLIISLILAVSIIRSITRPLKDLVKASEEIGEGDLSVRLDQTAKDEFGELSRSFNRMSMQLAESQKQLESQKENLKQNLSVTEKQKKDLQEVNHELDQFVHTVSHDIRSPLMGISWYADFLKKQEYEHLSQKGRQYVDGVIRGVEKANALISDLLTLTRLSRVHHPYQQIDIRSVIEDVMATLEYRIQQTNTTIDIQGSLPTIICDGIKIKEVFLNLMTNAIKFSSKTPEKPPVVTIGWTENTDFYEFFVKDNGIGIAPQYHEQIFDIFKRVEETSDKYEGTGAGLSIVKRVIEDHGGRVWVFSEPNKGAAFHFTIPKSLSEAK